MAPAISFAVITRQLLDARPMIDFLANASSHGHAIHSLIIGFTDEVDPVVVRELSRYTTVDLVEVGGRDESFRSRLLAAGVSKEDYHTAFWSRNLMKYGRISYARNRNTVLAAALLNGTDHLLCFDTDVLPRILLPDESVREFPAVRPVEIDFVGAHEESLRREEVFVTSSDYSGYYILPPMVFDGLEDFLIGIQKEAAFEYLLRSAEHRCLNLASADREPHPTRKLLGGNLGLDLTVADRLPPFYSTFFMFNDEPVLGRGEDTLLGTTVSDAGGVCMDIGLQIFHDTFGDFPIVPDAHTRIARDRLYRGSLGWIGRNPFLNWYRCQCGFEERELPDIFSYQREHLLSGSRAAARELEDSRFLRLPEAFDLSVSLLDEMIEEYRELSTAWTRITRALMKRALQERTDLEANDGHSQLLGAPRRKRLDRG